MASRRSQQNGKGHSNAPSTHGRGMPQLQSVHRFAFVQELMRHGCLSERDAKATLQKLVGSTDDALYRQLLSTQNQEMAVLNFQIKTIRNPVDKEKYVGFINTHADAASKFGTRYSHQQRDFFRHTMESIAADERAANGVGSVSETALLNMDISRPAAADAAGGSQAKAHKMTKQEKADTLRQLVADKWLVHAPTQGHYCIGIRTFLELSEYLLSLDIPDETKAAWQAIM